MMEVTDKKLLEWYYSLNEMLGQGLDVGKATNEIETELRSRGIFETGE